MKNIIKWVSEARPDKDIGVAMTYYLVRDGFICATNGDVTVGHPWPNDDDSFLVSGAEFERVLARMGDEVFIEQALVDNSITVTSNNLTATIATLPVDLWSYSGVADAEWLPMPDDFVDILKTLRVFVDDKPVQAWRGCVAIEEGHCYATNGYAVAGCACEVGEVRALLPAPAVDFLMRRAEDLDDWAWKDDSYMAFRWQSGAWMRTKLVLGKFDERATALVRKAYDAMPSQEITDEFREAFAHVAALAEDAISVHADRIESRYKRSVIKAMVPCEVPEGRERSLWGAGHLAPVIARATHWQPSMNPQPTYFRGDNLAGFIVGRKQ